MTQARHRARFAVLGRCAKTRQRLAAGAMLPAHPTAPLVELGLEPRNGWTPRAAASPKRQGEVRLSQNRLKARRAGKQRPASMLGRKPSALTAAEPPSPRQVVRARSWHERSVRRRSCSVREATDATWLECRRQTPRHQKSRTTSAAAAARKGSHRHAAKQQARVEAAGDVKRAGSREVTAR